MSDLRTTQDQLVTGFRRFSVHWAATKDSWNDQARDNVGRTYIEPLQYQTQLALKTLAQLVEAVENAQRDLR